VAGALLQIWTLVGLRHHECANGVDSIAAIKLARFAEILCEIAH
jgi:hypothetical protein